MCTCPLRSSAFCSVRWCSLPSRTRTPAFRSHSEQMVVSSTCTVCVQRQKSHWLLFVSCCMPMTALLSPIVSMIYNNWRTPSQLPSRGLGCRSVSRKQRWCLNLQEDPTASTPKIKIDGKILNCVDSFTYLGSSLSSSNSLDKEISTRIAKASASYGRLQKRVWCDRGLSVETKCAVYKAVVLSALLYGCESWTLYWRHIKLLDQFHQRCLWRIMNIKWFNKVTNVKVLQKAKTQSIDTLLTLSQLRWSGHLGRMSDDRLPKQLFYSELSEGHRLRGRPTLRFKDTLKK